MKKILVTGCAGFIGSHLTEKLLEKGFHVVGIDNFDPYYDKKIKLQNLSLSQNHPKFSFIEIDLADKDSLNKVFPSDIELIVHLAGKAGVRPSIEDPTGYIRANITATQNILDEMKYFGIKKMVFASSSSVYGNLKEVPFKETMDVSNPISPYAATKKACELINYTYHYIYNLDILNLRFFTVFGPRQRPDLAIHKFTKLIRSGQSISMFGNGETSRDYTYIEDILSGIIEAIHYLFNNENVYEIVNLGNSNPVLLRDMISIIYDVTGEKPNINKLSMQPGDVDTTYADITKAKKLFGYQPKFDFKEGVKEFISWYDKIK